MSYVHHGCDSSTGLPHSVRSTMAMWRIWVNSDQSRELPDRSSLPRAKNGLRPQMLSIYHQQTQSKIHVLHLIRKCNHWWYLTEYAHLLTFISEQKHLNTHTCINSKTHPFTDQLTEWLQHDTVILENSKHKHTICKVSENAWLNNN